MTDARILDAAAWRTALADLPPACGDVYFTPDYHALHVANGDGEAVCVVVRDGDATLLVPGLRRTISHTPPSHSGRSAWDLETCNGYGGPVASSAADSAFLRHAWTAFRQVVRDSGGVAAFFRLHPLLENEASLPPDAVVVDDRQTIYVDLSGGLEGAWKRAEGTHRNMVRKARRQGVEVSWTDPDPWPDFEALYAHAMRQLGAPDRLRFSRAYFSALQHLPGVELATVRDSGGLAAGAVFLFGPVWAHYHLAARRAESGNHLGSYLIQAGLERAAQRGQAGLFLGGGRTRDPDDGLLRFKRSLGGEAKTFRVALVVADRPAYEQLIRQWTQRAGRRPAYLLGYRQLVEAT